MINESSQLVKAAPRQQKTTARTAAPDFMYPKEVAEMLRLSRASVYRLVAQGKLPAYRPCRKLLFKRQDVLNYLELVRYGGDES